MNQTILIDRVVIKNWGSGIFPGYWESGPRLLLLENRRKIEPKEIPSRLIPRLLVVFTRQLEILVTSLNRAPWTNKTSLAYLNRIEVINFSNFTLTTSFFWYDFSALHLSINFIHFTRQWCSNSVSFFWRYSSRISKFLTFLWKLSLQVLKEFDNWRKKHQSNVNYLFEYDFMVTKNTSHLFSSIATVTSVFAVKGLFYSRTNDTFCLFFTLKRYCLVALNYRWYKILRNTYLQGFK